MALSGLVKCGMVVCGLAGHAMKRSVMAGRGGARTGSEWSGRDRKGVGGVECFGLVLNGGMGSDG